MTASITDFSHFSELRSAASNNDPQALREVAGQFEALFIQSLLKNMREASLGDDIFGQSDQQEMYQGMMDDQLAMEMASGKGIGLAEMLVRQLGGDTKDGAIEGAALRSEGFAVDRNRAATVKSEGAWATPDDFVRDIWPHAKRVAKELNVAPQNIVAHAALESGWGAHVMPNANGGNSYNLFGIKSSAGWNGETVNKSTLELRDGALRPERADFRAYDGVQQTFGDYETFLGQNARYDEVRNTGGDIGRFARALQTSGYATDPNYAQKLQDIAASPTFRRAIAKVTATFNFSHDWPIDQKLVASRSVSNAAPASDR